MSIKMSTGLVNALAKEGSLRDVFMFSPCKIEVYSGPAPSSADDAATGTKLLTLTNNKLVAKAAQVVTLNTGAPVNDATYTVTLNGVAISYVADASATKDEITAGLKTAIDIAQGAVGSVPAINNPKLYRKFTVVDNGGGLGTMTITAATAGVPFDYEVSGGNLAAALTVADAYGLHFEASGGVTSGELEKLSTQTWSGAAVSDGTPGYWRLVRDNDTGVLSTSEVRMQGATSTVAGSDMTASHATVKTGETITVDTALIRIPQTA